MEQFISSLDIPFHSDLGSRLLNALTQFHADEKHPERHNLRHKEDSAQVDKVFYEFLRKYGEVLFGTAGAQMQYPGMPVYEDTMSAADMMKSFRPIRSALLHLSKNWRQRKVREEEREKRMRETTLNAIENPDASSESGSNYCDDSQETASVIMPFKTRNRASEHAAAAAPPTTPRLSSSSTMPSFTDRHVSSNSKPAKKRPSSVLEEDEPLDSSSSKSTRTLQDHHVIRTLKNPSPSLSKLSSHQTPSSKPLKKHITVKLCVPNSRYQWIEWRYGALLSKLSIHSLFDGVAKSYGIPSNNDFTLRLLLVDARPEEKVLVLRREVAGDLKRAIEAITKIIETQSYQQQGNFRVCMLPIAVEEEELEIEI